MAEGGYDPTDSNEKTPLIPSTGDDDDGDDAWADVDWNAPADPEQDRRRNPFEPAASSTPADSERIALKTRTRLSPEKQGTSDETSFTTGFDQGVTTQESMVRYELGNEFPNMSLTELAFRYKEAPKSGGTVIEVKYHTSDKWYRLYTQSKGNDQKTLNTALPKQITQALGKSTTESINKTNAVLSNKRKQRKNSFAKHKARLRRHNALSKR